MALWTLPVALWTTQGALWPSQGVLWVLEVVLWTLLVAFGTPGGASHVIRRHRPRACLDWVGQSHRSAEPITRISILILIQSLPRALSQGSNLNPG